MGNAVKKRGSIIDKRNDTVNKNCHIVSKRNGKSDENSDTARKIVVQQEKEMIQLKENTV